MLEDPNVKMASWSCGGNKSEQSRGFLQSEVKEGSEARNEQDAMSTDVIKKAREFPL